MKQRIFFVTMDSDIVWNLPCCKKKISITIVGFLKKKIDLQYNSPSVEEGFVPGRNKLKILVITKALIFDSPKPIIRHKKTF